MVFSTSCIERGQGTGVALAIPLKRPLESASDLVAEVSRLWSVEAKQETPTAGTLSGTWGSIALLPNPNVQLADSLVAAWEEAVAKSPHYGMLDLVEGEAAVLDKHTGLALIPWPTILETDERLELDALFLSVTSPTLVRGRYPSPARAVPRMRAEGLAHTRVPARPLSALGMAASGSPRRAQRRPLRPGRGGRPLAGPFDPTALGSRVRLNDGLSGDSGHLAVACLEDAERFWKSGQFGRPYGNSG